MDTIFQTMIGSLTLAQLHELKKYLEGEIHVKSGLGRMLPSEIAVCRSKGEEGFFRRIEAIKLLRNRLGLDLRAAKAIVDEECPLESTK